MTGSTPATRPIVDGRRSSIPPSGRAEIEREGLARALDRAWEVRLTVVVGPAGYGKTTAVAAWARRQPVGRVAWLTLDPHDRDGTRFARRLHDALAEIGDEVPSLVPGGTGSVIDDDVLADLAAEREGRDPVVLVVDDLHAVSGSTTADDVVRLADGAPDGLRLVVTSRREPRLNLGRRRVAGDLVELRQRELALSGPETAALIERLGVVGLDDDTLRALTERTEGWAAGVLLAGVALRSSDVRVDELLLDDRHVVEYFTEEVLDHLDPEVRRFLLRISVLDVVDGPLADAVTGRTGSGALLERLAHDSLFISPMDAAGTAFRFHRLFSRLLRARLAVELPGEEAGLLTTGAAVLLGRGRLLESGELLRRAADWTGLLELVQTHARTLYELGETTMIVGWIRSIPDELRRDPDVGLLQAEVLTVLGAVGPAESILATIDLDELALPRRVLADTLRAAHVLWGLDARRSADAATRAIESIDRSGEQAWTELAGFDSADDVRVVSWFLLGMAELALDDLAAAVTASRTACEVRSAYPPWRINALGGHAVSLALAGELDAALGEAERGLRLAEETGYRNHWSSALCHVAAAVAHLDGCRVDAAQRHLASGSSLIRRNGRVLLAELAASIDAEVEREQGRPDGAIAVVEAHRAAAAGLGPGVASRLAAVEARALLDLGRSGEAAIVVGRMPPTPVALPLRARLAAESGDAASLRRLLAAWPDTATRHERFDAEMWWAVLAHLEGSRDGAARFESLAEQVLVGRCHRWLAEGGRTVRRALRRAAEVRPTPAMRQVVDLVERRAATAATGAAQLVEPLTERELEVVAFLPTRLTNAEVASELYVSANTLKTHLARIYRKLGVSTRDEAIERCGELGLL